MRPKIINPLKGVTNKSWFFEQQVYSPNGIARAIKSTDGSGNIPKVIIMKKKILAYDDYNGTLPPPHKQGYIGTLTPQCGNPAPRHGWKIIEVYEDTDLCDKRQEAMSAWRDNWSNNNFMRER